MGHLDEKHIRTDVLEGHEAENGIAGARSLWPLLFERRSHVPILHIDIPPEISIGLFLPTGRYDPVDRLFYCPDIPSRDAICFGMRISIKPTHSNVTLSAPDVFTLRRLLVAVNWSRESFNSTLIGRLTQFSIFDPDNNRRENGADLVEYFIEKGEDVGNFLATRWMNRNAFLRTSSTLSTLPNCPGMGVRVSATPCIATDDRISRSNFLRLTISCEIGKMEDLSLLVSEPEAWDLSRVR